MDYNFRSYEYVLEVKNTLFMEQWNCSYKKLWTIITW